MVSPDQNHLLIDDAKVGFTRSFTRTVTEEDHRATMRLTGDLGGYHTDEDFARAAGFRRTILPGLFQAGMVTRLGGSFNFLARETAFAYLKPVYVGDTLTCTFTLTAVQPERRRLEVAAEVVNQDGVVVLTMTGYGYLPLAEWGVPRKPDWP